MAGTRKSRQSQIAIWRTWGTLMPQTKVAVRFVLGGTPNNTDVSWHPRQQAIVWTEHEEEHPKTVEWFQLALALYPLTPWISHADDDTYVNTRVLFHELSRIQPERETFGLMYSGYDWVASADSNMRHEREFYGARSGRKHKVYEAVAIDSFVSLPRYLGGTGHGARRRLVTYPFLQGGFYAMSRDLIALLHTEAMRLWQAYKDAISSLHIGEDAFVFMALHNAAAATNVSYRLRHLTWSRFHFLPIAPEIHKEGGMGWVYPSAEASSVVHWIKHGSMDLVHNITQHARRPIFEPFRYVWNARLQRIRHDATDQQARWSIYRKCCWIFGCHAPYRGGHLKDCFLNKSRDLSPEALHRIRFDFPFNEKEFLGSKGFPI